MSGDKTRLFYHAVVVTYNSTVAEKVKKYKKARKQKPKETLLFLIEIKVNNPDHHPHQPEEAIAALSDSKIEKSFITEKLARNIELTLVTTKTVTFNTSPKI